MTTKIVALDIKRRHPKRLDSNTDFVYARFGNQVLAILDQQLPNNSIEERIDIAITITLYMEDIIAESGLWHGFVMKHNELYGKPLPFYSIDEDGYFMNEPNVEDIQFLIWNSLSLNEGELIHPINPFILHTAQVLFNFCLDHFETLPVNEALHDYFHRCDFMNDFITMRFTLEWLLFSCYLTFTPQISTPYQDLQEQLYENLYKEAADIDQARYMTNSLSVFLFKIGPLALYPYEWLESILKANGQNRYARRLSDMVFENIDFYKVIEEQDEGILFKSSDGKERFAEYTALNLKRGMIGKTNDIIMSLVFYQDRWELNGVMSTVPNDNNSLETESSEETGKTSDIGIPNYKKLMKLSSNSPLFYFRDEKEYREFLLKDMGLKNVDSHVGLFQGDGKNIVVFIPSPTKGFDTCSNAAQCICDKRNPYYVATTDQAEQWNLFIHLSTHEMLQYLFKHDMLPHLRFPCPKGLEADAHKIVTENWEFLERTFKRINY
ncbi:DUF3843 family protein [Prevotella sp. A2931]|uniref:DUF3843 family protein n=1 Tax=Prevotella illustrans TaxID=2800387 RepID=A0ABS3M6F8_9BACT|nr:MULTISPECIES: DUF3843 family protein [Prevotella]MBO1363763.1 DUF3843 family protein [Prevotella illustrans]PTL26249.1 hypothetical protein C3V39_03780 [Prevotella sp. oral taxon 820]